MARRTHRLVASLALGLCLAPTLHAQDRQLSWPSIEVTAHLDADGRLHVRELQQMRFTGDWNGGERRFDVRFGQSFTFDSIVRIDAAGVRYPLVEGDLDDVGEYDVNNSERVRWRSRMPDDPPFDNTLRTYALYFRFGDILEPVDDSTYRLAHDFAFADRDGAIERFSLALTFDSVWRVPGDVARTYTATLPPGDGFVVTVPLVRVAGAPPVNVWRGASPAVRGALLFVLLAGVAALVTRLLRHDAARGRFAPLPPRHEITPTWLEREVYAHLPEVVGTAWDDSTSEAEVAATLARLVQEGKLASRIETSKVLVFSSHVLHLELQVPRNQLVEHERTLVDALFDDGATRTDTQAVRARYKKTGFDPASLIRGTLKSRAEQLVPSVAPDKPSRIPTMVLTLAAIALLVAGIVTRPLQGVVAFVIIAGSFVLYGLAQISASIWRRRVYAVWVSGSFVMGLIAVMTVTFAALVLSGVVFPFGPLALTGLTLLVLALVNSICNRARLALSDEQIVLRRRLAAARAFFEAELEKPTPELTDEAYPYLIAFGLGSHVDKWFKSFGAEQMSAHTAGASVIAASAGSGGTSGSGPAPFGGFGGGGGFSGGGGGASFGAAISGMASSVPSPSSSSSGSSSGGGSSGGGGGGGW